MARAQAQIQAQEQASPNLNIYQWYSVGPAPMDHFISTGGQSLKVSGRVTTLAVDPSNPGYHWLLGAAQGGIWETTNSGNTWFERTDDQTSLAMGAITFAPGNASLVYAGTGEPNFSGDSYAGAGLLVSTDGGTTWQMLNSSFAGSAFSAIRVDVYNQNNVNAAIVTGIGGVGGGATNPPDAATPGLYNSTNGGTNFNRVLTGDATDLIVNSANFQQQYAALGNDLGDPTNGVYRTTNGWASWDEINGPWTGLDSPTNMGRIALAISPETTAIAYIGVSYPQAIGGLIGIWETTNAWDISANISWTQLPTPDTIGALWYSFVMSVDPNDFTTVYLGEETLWRYSSGSWDDVGGMATEYATSTTHADQHAIVWVPQGFSIYKMLLGNDGGAWLSSLPVTSSSWQSLNSSGLAISQIYKGAVHPSAPIDLIGTQDNGSAVGGSSLTWSNFLTGDGGDNAISSSNPDTDWAASWETFDDDGFNYVNINRTQDAGAHRENVSYGIEASNAPFFVHFEKSPNNDDTFIAGTVQLWLCTNFFETSPYWNSNSPVMLNAMGSQTNISAVTFARSDTSSQTYAFGTEDGQLRITTNGGASWQDLDPLNAVPNRDIAGLAFHPTNADVLYVALSGFDEGTPSQPGHLFETTNARSATPLWMNVSPPVDLPNNCLAIDPANASSIFVGSDLGVWQTSNDGQSWTHLGPGSGMPNVAVFDLRFNSASQVTAFTHGRGAFVYAPINLAAIIANANYLFVPVRGCLQCPMDPPWVNPGDLVTISIALQGVSTVNTVDLTATMLPSAQVQPMSGTQDYGVVTGQGPPVSRAFEFIANNAVGGPGPAGGACGGTVQVVLQLQDQGTDLGQVTVPFSLGKPSHLLAEDFEEVTPPALPGNWDTAVSGADAPWTSTTNNPPNVVPANAPDDGGGDDDNVPDQPAPFPTNTCAYASASPGVGETMLYTPPFSVTTSQAQLYFTQAFTVSNDYDGCILEIAVGSQPFQDILQAGGSFALNGYNAVLTPNNPLGARSAWSGNSGGWLPTVVNLPASAAGQNVQLRWNFATSRGLTNGGWFIDTVEATEPICLPPVSDPVLVNAAVNTNQFTFVINTVSGRTYVVEYKTNLLDSTWQFLENISGNGNQQIISVPISSASQSFYRFHLQP